MKRIAFTLCSNNYLAQAKTLADSYMEHNPDDKFIIGLVDIRQPQVDYSRLNNYEIITVDEIQIPALEKMQSNYNIIEFNTSVKPFYFEYLFKRFTDCENIYYLDPDIKVYANFNPINSYLQENNILLTPHAVQPKIDVNPLEPLFLNVGIFNLGFLGVKRSEESTLFINWFKERLKNHCRINIRKGLYVDQLWMNFAVILFKNVKILKEPGLNMAFWNLHERKLIQSNNKFYVNNLNTPLFFYHFSNLNIKEEEYIINNKDPKFRFNTYPEMKLIYQPYKQIIIENGYKEYSKIKCGLKIKKRFTVIKYAKKLYGKLLDRINK